jgi:hypothetical protein
MATSEDVLQNEALPALDNADTEVDATSRSSLVFLPPADSSTTSQVMRALKLLTESYERERRGVRSGTRVRSRPSQQ